MKLIQFALILSFVGTAYQAWADQIYLTRKLDIPKNAQELLFQDGYLLSYMTRPNFEQVTLKKENPNLPECRIKIGAMGEGLYDSVTLTATERQPRPIEVLLASRDEYGIYVSVGNGNDISTNSFIEVIQCFRAPFGTKLNLSLDSNTIIHDTIPQFSPAIFNWQNR